MKHIHCILLFVFGIISGISYSQNILIDRGIQADGLWCFPLHHNENTYVYLPLEAKLSMQNDSLPQFSYMRYIIDKPSEDTSTTITEADGGAILHFLVEYSTPSKKVSNAENFIREKLENDSIKIRGPIIFDKGQYTLISSILNPKTETGELKLLGSGEAPILENSKIALSFSLDPINSKLLLESFKMATPDVSLIFELGFSGLTDSYEAELEIDWSEVTKSKSYGAGGSVYFIGADVEASFDKLRRDNAIKFTSSGSDDSMESLVQTVYSKLLELMYKPVQTSQVPKAQRGGIEDAIASLIGSEGALGSRKTTGFGLNVAYQQKEHKSSGKSHMLFNGRSSVSRNHFITFNAGNLYKNYGNNPEIFKDVPLWDPAFQQRKIFVGIDGNVEREFNKMINSVTVTLQKKHQNEDVTLKEVLLNKNTYKDNDGKVSMTYLNHDDDNRMEWLKYDYKTNWKFIGGGDFTTDWKQESSSMINLYTPFERKRIEVTGDLASLNEQQIRAVSVSINYQFFDEEKSQSLTIYPSREMADNFFEITIPKREEAVNYNITWFYKDQEPITKTGIDKYGLIFIDEIPK